MGERSTSFQNLNLSNYFLFAAAAEDEETSRLLLEPLLGIKVGKVKVSVEQSFLYSSDFRSGAGLSEHEEKERGGGA